MNTVKSEQIACSKPVQVYHKLYSPPDNDFIAGIKKPAIAGLLYQQTIPGFFARAQIRLAKRELLNFTNTFLKLLTAKMLQ